MIRNGIIILSFLIPLVLISQETEEWVEIETPDFGVLIPSNWKVIKHKSNSYEFVSEDGNSRLYASIEAITDDYDIDKHIFSLKSWVEKTFSSTSQLITTEEYFTSSCNLTYDLISKEAVKVNLRINTLGYKVLTCVYVSRDIEDFNKDLFYFKVHESLMHFLYRLEGLTYNSKNFRDPKPISSKNDIIGSWIYGNTHTITTKKPGYANDITIERTKAIDNSGINYTFYSNEKYKLTYKATSVSTYGRISISFMEIGDFEIKSDGEIIFKPQKLKGVSSLGKDERLYNYGPKDLQFRYGLMKKLNPRQIELKEPCSRLMAETWCDQPKPYSVIYTILD